MLYTAQAACQTSMQHNGLFKIYQIRTSAVRSFDFEKKVLKTKDWGGWERLPLAAHLNAQTAMMSDAPWTISSQAMLFYKASYFSRAHGMESPRAEPQRCQAPLPLQHQHQTGLCCAVLGCRSSVLLPAFSSQCCSCQTFPVQRGPQGRSERWRAMRKALCLGHKERTMPLCSALNPALGVQECPPVGRGPATPSPPAQQS